MVVFYIHFPYKDLSVNAALPQDVNLMKDP